MILLYIFTWWLIGFCGHIYWWRYEYDVDMEAIVVGAIAGFLGPVMWVIGWVEFSPKSNRIVLWKKRK